MRLPDILLEPIVRTALAEDLGRGGDITASLMTSSETLKARVVARTAGIVAGVDAARIACRLVDPNLVFSVYMEDGAPVGKGGCIAEMQGAASSVLTAERTALNFLTHLSGIATQTRAFVDLVAGTKAAIAATRKTLPGLRAPQKAAVVAGGGVPHRYGLDDAILIKDNHIAVCGSVGEALRRARLAAGHMRVVEVEVDRLDQVDEAIAGQPHAILLDNFSIADLHTAVVRAAGSGVILEASGGVNLSTVRSIAETGVDVISVGALTHSSVALDIGLDAS